MWFYECSATLLIGEFSQSVGLPWSYKSGQSCSAILYFGEFTFHQGMSAHGVWPGISDSKIIHCFSNAICLVGTFTDETFLLPVKDSSY